MAWGLLQAAKRLDDATKSPEDRDGLLAVVRLNWKLWTIIQADILDDNSPLPLEVRQNLLTLSNFIDRHTVGIITTPDAEKLSSLVEINKNIAAGLFDSLRTGATGSGVNRASPEKGTPPEKADVKISTSA